jgi:type I restriction enzyme R subunit
LNSPAKRALYDNLGKQASLALAVDAVFMNAQDGWREHPVRLKLVRQGLREVLGDDDERIDQILTLGKHQDAY